MKYIKPPAISEAQGVPKETAKIYKDVSTKEIND